jgi:hypothetical protein
MHRQTETVKERLWFVRPGVLNKTWLFVTGYTLAPAEIGRLKPVSSALPSCSARFNKQDRPLVLVRQETKLPPRRSRFSFVNDMVFHRRMISFHSLIPHNLEANGVDAWGFFGQWIKDVTFYTKLGHDPVARSIQSRVSAEV